MTTRDWLALILCWFFWRRLRGIKASRTAPTDADKFPYGVAIAVGAFAMMVRPLLTI